MGISCVCVNVIKVRVVCLSMGFGEDGMMHREVNDMNLKWWSDDPSLEEPSWLRD